MLNKSFALGVNIIDHWNNHWTIFEETSISNTLSTLKFLWNFPFRPERKIILGRKNLRPQLSSLNYIYTSVEAPFRYRMILRRIGRSRNMTICDFRHVPILSVKNVMLSQHEKYRWLLCGNYMFGQTQLTVEIQFVWYLTTNNRLERMDSQKIVNYRTKSVIKQYIS